MRHIGIELKCGVQSCEFVQLFRDFPTVDRLRTKKRVYNIAVLVVIGIAERDRIVFILVADKK